MLSLETQVVHFFSYTASSQVCTFQAVSVLSIQLVVFWFVTMSPFLGIFPARFAQSANDELQRTVRIALY